MGRFRTIVAIGFALSLQACVRPISEDLSNVSIQVPDHNTLSKASTMAAIPAGRTACYGINVTGSGIPTQKPGSCSPETGVLGGFVESGQTLQASVPKGSARKIDLLLFLKATGDTTPCPALLSEFSLDQISKTYLVGSVTADLTLQEQTITITASFPGETQNIGSQLSFPAVCSSAPSGASAFGVSSSQGLSTGTNNKLVGRVGRAEENKVLTGVGNKLYVRE